MAGLPLPPYPHRGEPSRANGNERAKWPHPVARLPTRRPPSASSARAGFSPRRHDGSDEAAVGHDDARSRASIELDDDPAFFPSGSSSSVTHGETPSFRCLSCARATRVWSVSSSVAIAAASPSSARMHARTTLASPSSSASLRSHPMVSSSTNIVPFFLRGGDGSAFGAIHVPDGRAARSFTSSHIE